MGTTWAHVVPWDPNPQLALAKLRSLDRGDWCRPLPDRALAWVLGTELPERSSVERCVPELVDAAGAAPGEGLFVTLWEDDLPAEICVFGREPDPVSRR